MTRDSSLSVTVEIKRKQMDLPRYAVIPGAAVVPWSLAGTTTVEIAINGQPMKRRSIMRLDRDDWFVTVTEADCKALTIETGDTVRLTLDRASTDLPPELAALLAEEPAAKTTWEGMTQSRQRQLREHIGEAKQSGTRARRARKALLPSR